MKIYKSFLFATALAGALLTSCSDEGMWDQASKAQLGLVDGTTYAFDMSSASFTYEPDDVVLGKEYSVVITRGTTEGSATLPIQGVFSDSTKLLGPAEVTFADGENSAVYKLHVDTELEIGDLVTAQLSIKPENLGIAEVPAPKVVPELALSDSIIKYNDNNEPIDTVHIATHADSVAYDTAYKLYSDSLTLYNTYAKRLANYKLSTTVSISKVYNWTSLGVGTWDDAYWYETSANVEILQCVQVPTMFRVMTNFEDIADQAGITPTGRQSPYTDITILTKGEDFRGFTVPEDNWVYFTPYNDGYANSTGDAVAYHPIDFAASWMSRYGNTSYVAGYQANGLPSQIVLNGLLLVDYAGGRGWAPCQGDVPLAVITFPGVKIADYSASVMYAGLFTDVDNTVYVLGDLVLGPDATNAKAVVISGDADAAAVADAIAAGELEATDVEAGRIQLPMPEDADVKMQIVVAIIDDGAVQNVVNSGFEYYGGGDNPWAKLGTGLYTENFISSVFNAQILTYEVEIEEYKETPGLYRLKYPYDSKYAYNDEGDYDASTSYDIEVHAEDPEGVYIPLQPIGVDWSYGPMQIMTNGARYLANYSFADVKAAGYLGTLVDGHITFPVFERTVKDEDGNESTAYYQGFLYMGESGYYAGADGAIEITLPGAVTEKARLAARAAQAPHFGKSLRGVANFNIAKARRAIIKKAPVAFQR